MGIRRARMYEQKNTLDRLRKLLYVNIIRNIIILGSLKLKFRGTVSSPAHTITQSPGFLFKCRSKCT